MCAAFELNSRIIRPGRLVRFWQTKLDWGTGVWAGFARKETLGWWKRQGWQPIDIPAERFAERSDKTGELIWDQIPSGLILRGVLDASAVKPILKVVTRASTEAELGQFQHPRRRLHNSQCPRTFRPGGDH